MTHLFDNDQYGDDCKSLILKDGTVLPFQVLKSAAGYYIGTLYSGNVLNEPYSRESEGYWATREEAQNALDTGRWLPRI